jgi:signal transduction histidine kinase
VIARLVNNAIKFTNPKGRVKVIAKNLFKEMEIIISDTGIGIPEGDIPFIFQKFYRVSRPGTEIPGTGLGLVFVKQIIDLHKGFITVQSEVGKGTTFAIKLPKNHI